MECGASGGWRWRCGGGYGGGGRGPGPASVRSRETREGGRSCGRWRCGTNVPSLWGPWGHWRGRPSAVQRVGMEGRRRVLDALGTYGRAEVEPGRVNEVESGQCESRTGLRRTVLVELGIADEKKKEFCCGYGMGEVETGARRLVGGFGERSGPSKVLMGESMPREH